MNLMTRWTKKRRHEKERKVINGFNDKFMANSHSDVESEMSIPTTPSHKYVMND